MSLLFVFFLKRSVYGVQQGEIVGRRSLEPPALDSPLAGHRPQTQEAPLRRMVFTASVSITS